MGLWDYMIVFLLFPSPNLVQANLTLYCWPFVSKDMVSARHGGAHLYCQHVGGKSRGTAEFEASLVYTASSRLARGMSFQISKQQQNKEIEVQARDGLVSRVLPAPQRTQGWLPASMLGFVTASNYNFRGSITSVLQGYLHPHAHTHT